MYTHTHIRQVLGERTTNGEVYSRTTAELVEYAFNNRGKATVFAYGQTGAGKTYTVGQTYVQYM